MTSEATLGGGGGGGSLCVEIAGGLGCEIVPVQA